MLRSIFGPESFMKARAVNRRYFHSDIDPNGRETERGHFLTGFYLEFSIKLLTSPTPQTLKSGYQRTQPLIGKITPLIVFLI